MSVGWGRRPWGPPGTGARAESQRLSRAVEANEDYEDYEDYRDYEQPAGDDPGALPQRVTRLQLFEGRRNRRRREAPKVAEEQESKVQYTVCIW